MMSARTAGSSSMTSTVAASAAHPDDALSNKSASAGAGSAFKLVRFGFHIFACGTRLGLGGIEVRLRLRLAVIPICCAQRAAFGDRDVVVLLRMSERNATLGVARTLQGVSLRAIHLGRRLVL